MIKETIKFGDKDYSLVPVRLKKFREANPRADIDTNHEIQPDGSIVFKARITQDQSNEYSAKGSGTSHYSAEDIKKPKAFEKLETIAVGRALANLGYLNDGQIATTEEMEEFEDYKNTKVEEATDSAVKSIKAIKDLEELKKFFVSLPAEIKAQEAVITAKDSKKAKLSNEDS